MIQIEINNAQSVHSVDSRHLETVIRSILSEENVRTGVLSLAVVDDPTIHRLNRQYLNHDQPTDVLSFVLESRDDYLEGEVIVSAPTAAANAPHYGWSVADELTLYVTHGVLHLVGYDDQTPENRAQMRAREDYHLARLGLKRSHGGPSDLPAHDLDGPDERTRYVGEPGT